MNETALIQKVVPFEIDLSAVSKYFIQKKVLMYKN